MSGRSRAGAAFAFPAGAAVLAFLLLPTIAGLALSTTDFDIYASVDLARLRFVGLGNYVALLADPLFGRAFANTLLFVGLGVPLVIAAALGAALLLHSRTVRWAPLWRVALFTPYATTIVATAVVWRYLLDTRFGLINRALGAVGIAPVDWLGDPATSIPAVLLFHTWRVFGYYMILFSAALAATPQDLLDAARLDGAGPLDRLRHVVLPAIGPTFLLVAMLSATALFQLFDEPYIMTMGGPGGRTVTMTYFLVEQGFEWWSLGYASAVATLLFLCILAVAAIQLRLGRGWR